MDSGFWIYGLLVVACLVGCDGTTASESSAAGPRGPTVYGTAAIKGVVKFIGTPPPRATIANVPCHEDATKELKDETVIVNDNNTLANVLVYLEGLPASDGSEREPALLDQIDCRYVPHVVGVQVGQTLRIKSSDPTMHNVHYVAGKNPSANFGMTTAGTEKPVTFKNAETLRVKCDVHPWMTAYIRVFEHPFFAATGEGEGNFKIEKVPAGSYTLVAWHEQYGELRQAVEVKKNETTEASFEYKAPE